MELVFFLDDADKRLVDRRRSNHLRLGDGEATFLASTGASFATAIIGRIGLLGGLSEQPLRSDDGLRHVGSDLLEVVLLGGQVCSSGPRYEGLNPTAT
jgi:hypothetical protein